MFSAAALKTLGDAWMAMREQDRWEADFRAMLAAATGNHLEVQDLTSRMVFARKAADAMRAFRQSLAKGRNER